VQVGGPLGAYLPESHFDTQLDYEAFAAIGAGLGHGGIVAFDEGTDMRELARHLLRFGAHESCGKCFPCRIGSTRGKELLEGALVHGRKIDRALFNDLIETMEIGSLCALGGGLPLGVRNALQYFGEELSPHFTA
jgi:formate dehydrogenase iron-sulfur subunit